MSSSPPLDGSFTTDTVSYTPPHYALNGKIMAAAIIVLFLVIFLIFMLHVCAKWFWPRSSTRRGIAFAIVTTSAPAHTGLDKTAIAQLPAFVYKAPSSSVEAGEDTAAAPMLECAVCLTEFQENDKCRMLPSCKHTFHTECIDMWLFSHSTCPLCRMSAMPAAAATTLATPSTHEEHQGGGQQVAIEVSQDTAEGNHVASSAVEFPCNVLFWGNQAQVTTSQDLPSPSFLPSSMPHTRALPQITINIPPTEGNFSASAAGSLSAKSASCMPTDQAACSSQTPKSPGLRASIKRMLSRQSSRHRSSNQEGIEEPSK